MNAEGTPPAWWQTRWGAALVAFMAIAAFILFAWSFAKPQSSRDWRSFGAFSAFVVALFSEMYGFPLTINLLSGWLQRRYPALDLLSHDAGHLWWALTGLKGDPHFNVLHIASAVGFLLQWPTILTLALFPLLVTMYVRLARGEERDVRSLFRDAYELYAARTPAWCPDWRRAAKRSASGAQR